MKENNTTTSNNFTNFPFSDIPASLVEELLSKTTQIGNDIFNSINTIKKKKYYFRSQLYKSNILSNDSEIKTQFLTSCAVDGAYAIERLLGSDLIAIGTVGVEGLNSSDKKEGKWQSPNHSVFINTEKHDPENMIAARGLMIEMEINLAANSPYDLVFLDGSLTTGLIHMYKAIDFIEKRRTVIADKIRDSYKEFLTSYKKILESDHMEKQWVGIPKYTSRNDIGDILGWPTDYDDRAILTLILNEGEYTKPRQFTSKENWHMKIPKFNSNDSMTSKSNNSELESLMDEIIRKIIELHVIYYKPYKWSPALRIEIPYSIATDKKRLDSLLQNIKNQCIIPSIMEPYPLYLADRIAKHISPAIPAYKQILTSSIAELDKENTKDDISDIIFIMHSYRTESGM